MIDGLLAEIVAMVMLTTVLMPPLWKLGQGAAAVPDAA